MSIRINKFGGPLVWLCRKHFSRLTSSVALTVSGKWRKKESIKFAEWFISQEKTPLFKNVMVETINRCNGECAFCPANKNFETRPFKRMTESLYNLIIAKLADLEWGGWLYLCVNNEPYMDTRIINFAITAKEKLNCKVAVITNGTLLTTDKLLDSAKWMDRITINDYSCSYRFSNHIKELYHFIIDNSDVFANVEIVFNRRLVNEVLTNRAGNAPNKKNSVKLTAPCLYPYTDLIIFPDGKVGICCNDCSESTEFGNIEEEDPYDIWCNEKFTMLREEMASGRKNYPYCQNCDVIDAGVREELIRQVRYSNE